MESNFRWHVSLVERRHCVRSHTCQEILLQLVPGNMQDCSDAEGDQRQNRTSDLISASYVHKSLRLGGDKYPSRGKKLQTRLATGKTGEVQKTASIRLREYAGVSVPWRVRGSSRNKSDPGLWKGLVACRHVCSLSPDVSIHREKCYDTWSDARLSLPASIQPTVVQQKQKGWSCQKAVDAEKQVELDSKTCTVATTAETSITWHGGRFICDWRDEDSRRVRKPPSVPDWDRRYRRRCGKVEHFEVWTIRRQRYFQGRERTSRTMRNHQE